VVVTSLLIVRTGRIVTRLGIEASSAGYSEFPAYSQVLLKLAIYWNLRTVIVTAAVYRGLVSRLCRPKAANLST
jgi:hypothetical protein